MCGRSAVSRAGGGVRAAVNAGRMIGAAAFQPSYNIGPGRHCPVVRRLGAEDDDDEYASDDDSQPAQAGGNPQQAALGNAPRMIAASASSHDCKEDAEQEEDQDEHMDNDEDNDDDGNDDPPASGAFTAAAATTSSTTSKPQQRVLQTMKWGLVPSYSSDEDAFSWGTPHPINARSESVHRSSLFRRLLNKRRCVVPVDGFFEWHKTTKLGVEKKTPYYVYRPKGKMMFFAGLYDVWMSKDLREQRKAEKETKKTKTKTEAVKEEQGSNDDKTEEKFDYVTHYKKHPLYSYTVLTTSPSKALGWLHDRMPVILDEEGMQRWLDTENYTFEQCLDLLKPFAGDLEWHAVSDKVNKVGNDGPDIIERAEVAKEKQFAKGLGRFFTKSPRKAAKVEATGAAATAGKPKALGHGDDAADQASSPVKSAVTMEDMVKTEKGFTVKTEQVKAEKKRKVQQKQSPRKRVKKKPVKREKGQKSLKSFFSK